MPTIRKSAFDTQILAATVQLLELQKQRIDAQIQHVRALLGRGRLRQPLSAEKLTREKPTRQRRLSTPAKRTVSPAQRRRAENRKRQKTAGGK